MPVAEMLSRMSSREFAEWIAYSQLEPFGPMREADYAATVAVAISEPYRDRKRRASSFKKTDFFPELDQKHAEMIAATPEDDIEEVENEKGEKVLKRKEAPAVQLIKMMFPKEEPKK